MLKERNKNEKEKDNAHAHAQTHTHHTRFKYLREIKEGEKRGGKLDQPPTHFAHTQTPFSKYKKPLN